MNKRESKWILLIAGFYLWGDLGLPAADNLIANPGFELSKPVKIAAGGTDCWASLLENGTKIETGEAVVMPVWWLPGSGDGWTKGCATSYRYVSGQAGSEVHSGSHALLLSSEPGRATVMGLEKLSVVEDIENARRKKALPLRSPFFYRFYAKGKGTVACSLYTYPFGRENYGLYKATPAQFTITDKWTEYEGRMEFTNLDLFTEPGRMADSGALLVMVVSNGAATIDDVGLYLTPPRDP